MPAAVARWLTPAWGIAVTASVDETVFDGSAPSGTASRYDAEARQYVDNSSTEKVTTGYSYRGGVQFEDGQADFLTIAPR